MNPYASHLGSRSATEVVASTPAQLEMALEKIGVDAWDRQPAPGKWSPREILCHLADCEIVFAFRLRQTIAEDRHVIQPFDQDKFAESYRGYDLKAAMAVFASVRRWNVQFLATLPPESKDKPAHHPERGDMTFQTILETMAGHDLNHLKQLAALSR